MKEKEKSIYGIHQYTLTRRRKVRGKKRKQTKTKQRRKREKNKKRQLMCVKLFTPLSCKERKEK
jgi:hypothetical protein